MPGSAASWPGRSCAVLALVLWAQTVNADDQGPGVGDHADSVETVETVESPRRRADDRPSGAPAPGSAAATLQRALRLYVQGHYRRAAALLRPLVETRALPDAVDQLEALRCYGTALYLIGSRAAAERAFRELLRLSPSAELDRDFVRPEVIRFFEQVRGRYLDEMNRVVARSAPRGSALLRVLPPLGQFYNGHRTKAYALLGGEIALLATSLTTGLLLYAWQDDTGQFQQRESTAEALIVVNRVSFVALAALLVYGIVDGLYYYYNAPTAKLTDVTFGGMRGGRMSARPARAPRGRGILFRF